MRTAQVCIWDEDMERLKRIAKFLKVPLSAVLRNAIDHWLEVRGLDPLALVEHPRGRWHA